MNVYIVMRHAPYRYNLKLFCREGVVVSVHDSNKEAKEAASSRNLTGRSRSMFLVHRKRVSATSASRAHARIEGGDA